MDPDRARTIRARIAEDMARGEARTLADYAAAFPGEDALVARTYAEFHSGAGPDMSPRDAGMIAHYRIVRTLGRGGQGVVYLAEDTHLRRKVALKVLTGVGVGSTEAVQRFQREAELASKLDHPGICRVFDAGVADGLPYIAMQFVEGTSLAERVAAARNSGSTGHTSMVITFSDDSTERAPSATRADDRTRSPDTVAEPAMALPDRSEISRLVRIFAKVAIALHAAHEAGIVHRDIKPGNIMVTKDGEPVILDFGIARADDGDLLTLTRTGDVFGTPAYMAPEQLSGQGRVDRRADVYSLGVSLYECLTLRRPFDGATREGLYQSVLTKSMPDPRRINGGISKDAALVLETAIEKDLNRRYVTADALAFDLTATLDGRPLRARPIGPIGRFVRWTKREPAKAALLFVLLAALPTIAALVTSHVKDLPQIEAARRAQTEAERDAILSEAGYEVSEGDGVRAADLYRQALALQGTSPEAAGGLVIALMRLKQTEAAAQVLDTYANVLGDGSASRLMRAQVLADRGRTDEASALRNSVPQPRTEFEHYLMAQRELAKGEKGDRAALTRAFRHATAAVLLAPLPRLSACTLRAHVASHLADRDAVVDAVEGLQHHWPRSADALYWCAISMGALGDNASIERAVTFLRESLAIRPGDARAHSALGGFLGKLGRFEDALKALGEAVRLRPNDTTARVNLARAYNALDRHAEAMAECVEAARLSPESAEPHATLAATHEAAGRIDDAVVEFRRAVALDPGNADAHYNLSVNLVAQGLLDEALEQLRATVEIRPEFAQAYCNMGGILNEQELYNEALTAMRRGHELGVKTPGWKYPSKTWVSEAAAAAAQEKEREADARRHLDAGTKPDEPERLVLLARVALRLGHAATAVDWYRVAFEEAPDLADIVEAGHRRTAARAAAQAAAAPNLDDAARARFRMQALDWLEGELARLRKLLKDEGPQPRVVRVVLVPPTKAAEFAPMRDQAALEKLPDAERARWTAYWAASAAVRGEIERKTSTQ